MTTKLIRMRSLQDNLIIDEHEVLRTSISGRFTTLPGISAQGIKPARLGQFNRLGTNDFVIVDKTDNIFRDINFFMRKYNKITGKRIKVIVSDLFFKEEYSTRAEV